MSHESYIGVSTGVEIVDRTRPLPQNLTEITTSINTGLKGGKLPIFEGFVLVTLVFFSCIGAGGDIYKCIK